jgi:hypothetical protein
MCCCRDPDDLGRVGVVSHQACATLDGRPSTDVVPLPVLAAFVLYFVFLHAAHRDEEPHPVGGLWMIGVCSMQAGEGKQGDSGVRAPAWVPPVRTGQYG